MPNRSAVALLLNCLTSLAVLLFAASSATCDADDLHTRIDQLIEAAVTGDIAIAPPAADSEFLRRVYLDLAGRIPTVSETRTFLADSEPGKRRTLIESLLSGPDYPRRMQELFHVLLMERRGEDAEWTKFLRTAFEQNLPWHQIAAAILKPEADNEELRGAAFFQTQRLVKEGAMAPVDVPGLTRDVGRLLAGIDLQCAQCHDHLTVKEYLQRDFQGLHMVFENVSIRNDVKFPAIGEKLMKEQKEFSSVFEQVAMKTSPVIPGGADIEIAVFEKGDEYSEPPDPMKKTAGVPKFSALRELSMGLASPDNRLFCRNIVNRLWFVMMGRGLVEPLDLQHSENPASHPELFEVLATEFASHDSDIRWLMQELALTKTYQRSSLLPDGEHVPARTTYAVAMEKRVSAEQLFWSLGEATGEFDAVQIELSKTNEGEEATPSHEHLLTAEQLVGKAKALSELLKQLTATFANPPKEPETEFTPTVAGALYLMHADDVQKLLQPRQGNLLHRLSLLPSDQAAIEELWLSVLSRPVTEEETAEAVKYLSGQHERITGLKNLTWALLTSTEFVVNH